MKQATTEALWAAPSVTTGGLILFGVSLSNWVVILTAVYTIFLIIDKLPTVINRVHQLIRWVKEKFNGKESSD